MVHEMKSANEKSESFSFRYSTIRLPSAKHNTSSLREDFKNNFKSKIVCSFCEVCSLKEEVSCSYDISK